MFTQRLRHQRVGFQRGLQWPVHVNTRVTAAAQRKLIPLTIRRATSPPLLTGHGAGTTGSSAWDPDVLSMRASYVPVVFRLPPTIAH